MTLFPVERLRRYVESGLIRIQSLDDLIICNYTEQAMFGSPNTWDDLTLACRGLILRVDKPWPDATEVMETVALPMEKFFNYGEGGRLPPEGEPLTITEKADGSLGILFRLNGEYRIATRGSFQSIQAQAGTAILARHDLSKLSHRYTLLFEIIYPGAADDGIQIVDYGDREELVLLAIRDRFTGEDLSYALVRYFGTRWGFPVVDLIQRPLVDLLSEAKTSQANAEGWVLRYSDGSRWKIKLEAYRARHKFLSHFNRKTCLEGLIAGNFDAILEPIPVEYRDDALALKGEIEREAQGILDLVELAKARLPSDKREYARYLTLEGIYGHFALSLSKGRNVLPDIYRAMLKES